MFDTSPHLNMAHSGKNACMHTTHVMSSYMYITPLRTPCEVKYNDGEEALLSTSENKMQVVPVVCHFSCCP